MVESLSFQKSENEAEYSSSKHPIGNISAL